MILKIALEKGKNEIIICPSKIPAIAPAKSDGTIRNNIMRQAPAMAPMANAMFNPVLPNKKILAAAYPPTINPITAPVMIMRILNTL